MMKRYLILAAAPLPFAGLRANRGQTLRRTQIRDRKENGRQRQGNRLRIGTASSGRKTIRRSRQTLNLST
jgi:hypothetical protein